jgi:RNA polymerase sigma factor (sigma-70 family)
MKREWVVNQELFDRFLFWLDPNREEAGRKYEAIRRKLIKIFTCRGCSDAEDLADVTINRVVKKVKEIDKSYVGDPALYFSGVARKVNLERFKKQPFSPPLPLEDSPEEKELQFKCLERCLSELTPDNRQMVLDYYKGDKTEKIERRKEMAEELGINPNALRIRVHRVRATLQDCMARCLRESAIE